MHCLAALALGLIFSAPSLEDVNRAVKDVLSDSEIQSEYPGGDLPPSAPPPQRRRRKPPIDGDAAGLGSVMRALLWVLIGVGVVILVFWLTRRLGGFTRELDVEDAAVFTTTRAPPGEIPLDDAEVLAREGRYDEAVHVLLLLALRSIEKDGAKVSSNTSREVLREATLQGEARDAVMALVGAVELSLFGGRPAGVAGYRACVSELRRFEAARA